jgi:hypothetical protein
MHVFFALAFVYPYTKCQRYANVFLSYLDMRCVFRMCVLNLL